MEKPIPSDAIVRVGTGQLQSQIIYRRASSPLFLLSCVCAPWVCVGVWVVAEREGKTVGVYHSLVYLETYESCP